MATGDNLSDVVALCRQEMPDVPEDTWRRFTVLASLHFGSNKIYIPRQPKRRNLDALAAADETVNTEKLAKKLGITVRRVQQLKKLNKK